MSAPLSKPSAFENDFARQQEFNFNAQVRRNMLIGLWAAATMERHNATAYAEEMMAADIVEPDGIFGRLREDFDAAGVVALDNETQSRMVSLLKDAGEEMHAGYGIHPSAARLQKSNW